MRTTIILVSLMALLAGTSAQATLFTVSSNSGGSPANECTLVKAVQAANTNVAVAPCPAGSSLETDEIFVNVFGTIVLDQTLVVEDALIIRGISAGVTRLNGDNQRQIIRVNMQNLADNFTLQDIQIEEARTNSNTFAGAVQLMRGKAFDIQDVIFESNTTFTQSGGAIHAGPLQGIEDAALTIRSSRFQNNYAEDYGGAVYSATIDESEHWR